MTTQGMQVESRRWLLFKAHGVIRFLYGVQGCFEDVKGAVAVDNIEAASYQSRVTIIKCISILSLRSPHGELFESQELDQLNFNPFLGVDPGLVDRWLSLPGRAFTIDWPREKCIWLRELERIIEHTEKDLEFARPLETLRSPRGMSVMLQIATVWDQACSSMGLPSGLPGSWASKRKTHDGSASPREDTRRGRGSERQ